jgi:hypothetical protein
VLVTGLGVVLIGGGIGSYFYGWIGRAVERKWARLDPGSRSLTRAQQFALGRQRAVMRQGLFFRRVGAASLLIGIALVVLGVVTD